MRANESPVRAVHLAGGFISNSRGRFSAASGDPTTVHRPVDWPDIFLTSLLSLSLFFFLRSILLFFLPFFSLIYFPFSFICLFPLIFFIFYEMRFLMRWTCRSWSSGLWRHCPGWRYSMSSEMLVSTYKATRRNNPGDQHRFISSSFLLFSFHFYIQPLYISWAG